jgi:two-component system, NtrC family, response regulator
MAQRTSLSRQYPRTEESDRKGYTDNRQRNPDLSDFTDQYQGAPFSVNANPLESPGLFTLDEMEKLMIERTLQTFNHNIARVARSLGLSRGALYRRLEKYNIPYESEN